MIVVAGIIVIVVIVLLAVLGAGNAAKVMGVSEAVSNSQGEAKVQVSGTVVDNSYTVDEKGVLTFEIADEDATKPGTLKVSYDKGVSATFGNGITAICTGRIDADGVLQCTELVTKCPSKYENASSALTVDQLLGYGDSMIDKTAKVSGKIQAGSLADATAKTRFAIEEGGKTLSVSFTGAIPDNVAEGKSVVVTGALQKDGTFLASSVALEA